MSWKNLVVKLNVKVLSANQIARFLNFNISKTIGDINYNIDFLHAGTYLLIKLQIDDRIFGGCGQACLDMPKEVVKVVRSQKLKKV